MKTKEELQALKTHVEELNGKHAELTKEELEQEVGGNSCSAYIVRKFICYNRECSMYGMEQIGEASSDDDYKCPCSGCGHLW